MPQDIQLILAGFIGDNAIVVVSGISEFAGKPIANHGLILPPKHFAKLIHEAHTASKVKVVIRDDGGKLLNAYKEFWK